MDCVGTVKNRGLRKGDEKEDKRGERRRGEARRVFWSGSALGCQRKGFFAEAASEQDSG